MSADGRSVITASDGRGSLLKLWQWSQGAIDDGDKANGSDNKNHRSKSCETFLFVDSFELSEKYDQVESIRFSGNDSDSRIFVVTSRNGIAFGQWVSDSR